MGERRLGEDVVGEAVREARERVRRQRGDDEQVSPLEVRVGAVGSRPPSERLERLAPHEPVRTGRDERDHFVPLLHEEPRELASLVGGDATGNAEQNPRHGDILPARRRLVVYGVLAAQADSLRLRPVTLALGDQAPPRAGGS